MSEHKSRTTWSRTTEDFTIKTFDRNHLLEFEGGLKLSGSSAPEYSGDPARVCPEETFVAALSSCHMLTFLAVASLRSYTVDQYVDDAVGFLEKNTEGRLAMTRVELRPQVRFSGDKLPSAEDLEKMHEKAHQGCFIANSVNCEVAVIPPEESLP